jgi:hypothetical protein
VTLYFFELFFCSVAETASGVAVCAGRQRSPATAAAAAAAACCLLLLKCLNVPVVSAELGLQLAPAIFCPF